MGDLGTEVSQCSSILCTICLSLWDFPWSVWVKIHQSFRGFLENFGWKAGALQRDRLRAEAQLHQGQCWLVTEGDKRPYHYLLELLACLQSPVESQTSTLLKKRKQEKSSAWREEKVLQVMVGGEGLGLCLL